MPPAVRSAGKPAMLVSQFLCLIDRHKPRDRRADWNGHNYISKCGRCGERILRQERGRWVRDDRPGRGG